MDIVRFPNELNLIKSYQNPSIFLCGALTSGDDWQKRLCAYLESQLDIKDVTLHVPTRYYGQATEEAVVWEQSHLSISSLPVFWFPEGPVDPITACHLGYWGLSHPEWDILIGIDSKCETKGSLLYQIMMLRPDVTIAMSIESLVNQLKIYYTGTN